MKLNNQKVKHIDYRKKYEPNYIKSPYLTNRWVPVFITDKIEINDVFTSFALYEANKHLSSHRPTEGNKQSYDSHLNAVFSSLVSFGNYLSKNKLSWEKFNDIHFDDYKEWELENILNKPSSRNDRSASRSVNIKLKWIYRFFYWAQEIELIIDDYIGSNESYSIKSRIIDFINNPEKFKKNQAGAIMIYPKLFRRVGSTSRAKNTHYATDSELDDLRVFFRTGYEPILAERNVLMIDLIETVGFRQGTINSLTIDLFSEKIINQALNKGLSEISITPYLQKMGYSDSYPIPINLAIRIHNFCQNERQELLDNYEKNEDATQNMLFIADKTCKPFVSDGISAIISSGFKEIGSPKGSGAHSIRRKFGRDKATELMQIRKRDGRSIDPADVLKDLSSYLGHSNTASQEAYTKGKLDMYKLSREQVLQNRLEEERAKRATAETELAKLTRLIKRMK